MRYSTFKANHPFDCQVFLSICFPTFLSIWCLSSWKGGLFLSFPLIVILLFPFLQIFISVLNFSDLYFAISKCHILLFYDADFCGCVCVYGFCFIGCSGMFVYILIVKSPGMVQCVTCVSYVFWHKIVTPVDLLYFTLSLWGAVDVAFHCMSSEIEFIGTQHDNAMLK